MEKMLTLSEQMQLPKEEVIGQTVRKERKRLLGFIRRRISNEADAEDILQDVFFQLAANYNVMEPIEQMASWLFRVATNRITDWYRKRKPELLEKYPSSNEDEDNDTDLVSLLAGADTVDPDEAYERALFWEELAEALDKLPAEQREVFVLHELEGKSFKEIGEITGAPQSTLLSRKRYAVLALRERMKERYRELKE